MRGFRFTLGAVALGLAGLLIAAPAFAHTEKDAGPYKLLFGWRSEPAYTGEQNAVQLFVHDTSGKAIDSLGSKGLTVVVSTGTGATTKSSSPMALNSAFDPDSGLGTHGEFDAPILPTAPGTYTFHITGDINGTAVDVSAALSDTTFANVTDPTAIEFPVQTQTVPQLASAITTLQDRLAGAQSAAANAQSAANAAKSSATTSKTLAIVAVVVAFVLGLIALVAGRRKKARSAG
ncbi:MAG TPA: hypothetical protein VET24_04950 [Actinomycetota bacterium]|nr:hypothetical protein [Actinomycetota bacterium]